MMIGIKLTVSLLFIVAVSVEAVTSKKNVLSLSDQARSSQTYPGCRNDDTICDKRPDVTCAHPVYRRLCPRRCGLCASYDPKCPREYKFGCCWDGAQALNPNKSNCPVCEDESKNICSQRTVKRDCDLSKASPITRRLCPVTCGACGDYGYETPRPPICEDNDLRCSALKDSKCCESSEILREICPKTCGACR